MKAFLDTNVLVYAVDRQDGAKQAVAQRLLAARGTTRPTISTQVLAEVYNVLTRKRGWPPAGALDAVRLFASLNVVAPSAETVLQGLALAAQHRLSGWDSLIVQAAQHAGCDTLYSEDLQAGRRFGGLEIVNPFHPALHEPASAAAPKAASLARGNRRR